MKITRTEIRPISTQTPSPAHAGETKTTTSAGTRGSAPSALAVSPETLQLRRAAAQLASAPDVDAGKVDEIRQAIADGRLPLDLDALSRAVLELHRA